MKRASRKNFTNRLDYSPAPEDASPALNWLKERRKEFGLSIGGAWTRPGRSRFSVFDPSTGESLAAVTEASARDVDRAVEAARSAFPGWRTLPGYARARYLYAIARLLAKHARLFAVLESLNNGKTIRESRDIDIPLAIRHFSYHAGWAMIHGKEFPGYEPGGVIAQIIPWNFPLLMLAWKIAPAIAVGNTVVLKPAETTPLTALLFAEMLHDEAGLPAGVVNIITGGGKTGEYLVRHPEPWKIAFTGSTEIGRRIRALTAGTGKKLTLELGGKSPFIVFANADLDCAVEGVVDAIWFNQGQVCCAGSRLLVEESVREAFLEKLKTRMEKLRIGAPLDKTMDIGAINSQEQLRKIQRLCETGREEGARMWQPPGWKQPGRGWYFPPTIFTEAQPSHTIAREEIFGPVLVCMSFRTPAEAVQLANNTRYGLAGSVWSQDIDCALDTAMGIRAGSIWINSTNQFDAAAGFGGYRESGYGREGGREGILDVLREKSSRSRKWGSIAPGASEYTAAMKRYRSLKIDRTSRFLIDGKLARPDGQRSVPIYSFKNELLGHAGDAQRKDVRNAVQAARSAFAAWAGKSAHLRSQILFFMAENLQSERERFVDLLMIGSGYSGRSARKEFEETLQITFRAGSYADKYEGTVQPVPGRRLVTAIREPIGVVGIRCPDESPLLGSLSLISAALSMGNSSVTIAGMNEFLLLDLVKVIQNSDVPDGVVNILSSAKPDECASILSEHEDVDAVWYFGSMEGWSAVERLSTGNMKRTFCEGNAFFRRATDDWYGRLLHESTQIKNLWIPYGA